jgi:hypothetical protein
MYVAVTIVGWIVLASTPDILASLGGQAELDPQLTQLAAPLYAALVLTVLVSSFKPFRRADEQLRTFLHDLARIPWEAQRLSASLRGNTWLPTQQLQDRVRAALKDAEFSEQDISFADDRSPQALWTKITALHDHYFKRWQSEEQRRFAAFYHQHRTDFQTLTDEYMALGVAAKRVFRLLDTLRPMQADPNFVEVQKELIDGFMVGAKRLEKDICDLISRALLTCALTEKARREELESMGFMVNVAPDPTFDRLLLLYVILAGLYITVRWFAGRSQPLQTGAIIGTIYIGAVLAAFYPKRWAWARPNERGRPIRGYVLSGVIAFGFAMIASFSLGVLLTWDVKNAVQLLFTRWWPWSLPAAFMAATTAYNLDNEERPGQRWVEATLQAAIGAVGAVIVYLHLQDACGAVAHCAPPLYRMLVTATVTGGLIGWLVPTWWREPQTMTLSYRRWRVTVTAKVLTNGHIAPIIQAARPPERGQGHSVDPQASLLSFEEEFPSTEEALASAIQYARKHIDAELAAAEQAHPSAA